MTFPSAAFPAHTTEAQEYDAGDQRLSGTLWLPQGAGWYPCVVVVGDPAQSADGAAELLRALLTLGFAVLTFEPPPAGLAQAALAAADSLLMRPDIRPELIGLLGLGPGAWAAAFAAARAPETAFAVLLPGASALPGELGHLANLHCPVLALIEDDATASTLGRHLAHNPEVTIQRLPAADNEVLDVMAPWLQRQML